ncbi:type IV toxin-antitoxin system AbiEi family antitoxin domain-containing protein [Rhodococcus triatomae]|uniref:Transcriptional regulator, AbiEi antitoxin, Type IV TA system n=1 Tax=Rhodococcus triatomae TaxID=300028 RepID=A0A1G8GVX3_9NOCA|nr:type IV toxin-antitoxin system AbiEi family antitoxin domain-containing protein [Rhodococcus triatomae]QNG20289.1 type IV toxin-antitoxin system AbiEi family antitoxin domain-containing protein [Rhodococcus triatomae]QNG23796.1 type IV toxin-antitoxin system AbiEi family antitoxin domain-containing protein [Rhodococcus triatomae]SDH98370.1 Transcriptional regulator, AbiEi antitoxin, Type IV TA system [Rhodococcus triatomae]
MERSSHRVVRRQQALAAGYSDEEIRRRYTRGEWQRLGHGAYIEAATMSALDAPARHLLAVDAVLPALAPDAVLSHGTAAVVHGLPLWDAPLDRVHVTRDRPSGGRTGADVVVHASPLHGSVTTIGGYRVTSPARTVVDLACSYGVESAVVAGDAAARTLAVGSRELSAEVTRAGGRRGVQAARRAAALVDARCESVGESRSRVFFEAYDLPVPSLQHEFRDGGGYFLARVDFYWAEYGVIGEFDGRTKYGRLLRPGQEPGDAVFAEKLREDALRELGYGVVRWTWADLGAPEVLAARIRRALHSRIPFPHPRGD